MLSLAAYFYHNEAKEVTYKFKGEVYIRGKNSDMEHWNEVKIDKNFNYNIKCDKNDD
jgi:hypothetical protein